MAIMQFAIVCCCFGFVVVAILTWLQILCRRFVVAIMTCRRFDRVPLSETGYDVNSSL